MKKTSIYSVKILFLIVISIGLDACKKPSHSEEENPTVIEPPPLIEEQKIIQDTLLLIDYETGESTSGIPNLNTTNALGKDASYMISPGRTGNYAIAHKVVLENPDYFSDNHWRSESATAYVEAGRHRPGDERRYEFSLLLKDWVSYTTSQGDQGDIIFQGKLGGGGNPAWYFMTKRNTISFRMPNNDEAPQQQIAIITDYRPYINQWIDFRVDVLWKNDATGYYKVFVKLPEDNDYRLVWEADNFHTYKPDNPDAAHGYLKWGLYRPGSSLANKNVPTRIIYHDDIRVIKLPLKTE